jgi:hypothetical protein
MEPGSVKECLNDESPYFWIFDKGGKFNFGFSYTKSRPDCILIPSDDFSENVVYVQKSMQERLTDFALSNAMMLIYTFRTSPYETLMVHASVIRHNDGGYMFLGRSGTGKSTHSRLWLSHIDDTELLNDDNPVIRLVNGEVMVFGTPWSGKTHCYRNIAAPVGAIVRIRQEKENVIRRLRPIEAYGSVMASCSGFPIEERFTEGKSNTLQKIIKGAPCWELGCLPNVDAAVVCREAVCE